MKISSTTTAKVSGRKGTAPRANQDTASAEQAGQSTIASAGNEAASVSAVSQSDLAAEMRNLAATGSADIDVAHVESVRQALRDGTLEINPGRIADGVLEEARNLMKARPTASAVR